MGSRPGKPPDNLGSLHLTPYESIPLDLFYSGHYQRVIHQHIHCVAGFCGVAIDEQR